MTDKDSKGTPKKYSGRFPVIPTKSKPTPVPEEKINTDVKDDPLVDTKSEKAPKGDVIRTCPNHPKVEATTYGMCSKCYNKLGKAEKRKLYLNARLHGSNTHNYPMELRKVWRRELDLIGAGLWKKPLKTKAKTKLTEALMG